MIFITLAQKNKDKSKVRTLKNWDLQKFWSLAEQFSKKTKILHKLWCMPKTLPQNDNKIHEKKKEKIYFSFILL